MSGPAEACCSVLLQRHILRYPGNKSSARAQCCGQHGELAAASLFSDAPDACWLFFSCGTPL